MSKYEVMKLICMFDLPTDTADDRRAYRIFRKTLIENGFTMIQYSVYIRTCPNRVFASKFVPKLKRLTPSYGNVRLFMVTEKQYEDQIFFIGQATRFEELVGNKRIVVI
ncbi:MAG: CRISPR-associated endonuclease Cas2 [Bacilli bacterium]